MIRAAALAGTLLTTSACAMLPGWPPPVLTPAPAEWRVADPENVLLIDTTKGRILLELAPEAAPEHVTRIKQLAREKFYDGVVFHRVIDWFMSQTGDPTGTGEGGSPHPDLKAEFTFRRGPETPIVFVSRPTGMQLGFLRTLPVASQPDAMMANTKDKKATAWGLYCPGVAGMARDTAEDSADSQFFMMRQGYPTLERRYTVWGRVISGLQVVRAIKTGEPVVDPDRMTTVRVLADVPAAERPTVEVLDTRSRTFNAMVERERRLKGADFSPCDLDIPVRVR